MYKMKGFILAAGEGTRLHPVTLGTPKPLLLIRETPILTYLVNLYLKYGVNDIRINIQKKHCEDFYKWKANYFPDERIEFLIEEKPTGTFTPLVKVDKEWFSEPILVSNGDELKSLNLREMINWHLQKGEIATVGLVKVKTPEIYGVARMEGDKIIEFVEKPEIFISFYINSGLYVLNPEIRNYFPKTKFAMVETDLFPQLAKEKKLLGYKIKGKWQDVGTFEKWELAIRNWRL